VHGNIHELVDYGLVELKETGRSKRPVVWYDDIDVDIPLSQNGATSSDLTES
jgi:predicted transcriptional regulator